MTKKTIKSAKTRRGSALLVTLLIMSILLLLTLGLSKLTIGDVRSTVDVVDAGKAYYAAEAGIENALFELNENLPGYETEAKKRTFNEDQDHFAEYTISNQTQIFPFRDPEEYDIGNIRPAELYATLALNESITIPLFVVSEKDGRKQILNAKNFRVEYYVGYDNDPEGLSENSDSTKWNIKRFNQGDIDVLRWKIFGFRKVTKDNQTDFRTEAISDYFPVINGSNARKPMCFGTKPKPSDTLNQGIANPPECFGEFFDADKAREHYKYQPNGSTIHFSKESIGVETELDQDDTLDQTEKTDIKLGGYPISSFMEDHTNMYLTLTNIINPSVIAAEDEDTRRKIANIHYRILIFPDDSGEERSTVREFATIKSDGYFGDAIQSIDAKIKLDQFLPVFNFSLYRTSTDKVIQ